MLTPLLQNQFRPYSVRSHAATGRGQFTATLCCHSVRVGKVTVTRSRKERVDPKSDVTMVLEFDDATARKNFEAMIGAMQSQAGRSSQALAVDLVLQMVDAHLGDKRIHDLVRKGSVVYRLTGDPVNAYRVLRRPGCTSEVDQLRSGLGQGLDWIANEMIDVGKGLSKSAAASRVLH
ncbi:hypothetical protein H8Z72_22495 (plasmid) [Xanthomonas citri pv. citri]|uniref:hypothetical protein n=1 Tax=Xanthomonas citri TaxID=346 RepID=UPI001931C2BF|nr:hypothetical protein [Xanthomonas citri]QRD62700.1 hypothetical protein H8Z74_22585 [Xanthomonas citri pv. citri]QRD67027.1 hypothetical protein H8Z73_22670 [Xanthomonas citri pv. citri]QRD71720.1 hypothetical protein H8Z72_22495 [Xanthomonas citri pv. citri]